MSLCSVIDFIVNIEKFRNVDLVQQGYYRISVRLQGLVSGSQAVPLATYPSDRKFTLGCDDAGDLVTKTPGLSSFIDAAEKAYVTGQNNDASLVTPLREAAAQEGVRGGTGGKVDDIAIVCGVVRGGERPGLRMVHNFDGAADGKIWMQPPPAHWQQGLVVPGEQRAHARF